MIFYIRRIVWKYAKYEPENFKLLDVRHNVMKNLILGDCDHLIKFILFGDEESVCNEIEVNVKRQKKFETRHIPRNILWSEDNFIKDGDLDFVVRKDELKDNEKIEP